MYRFYAISFFLVSIIVLLFSLGDVEANSFLSVFELPFFIITVILFLSFPLVIIKRKFTNEKHKKNVRFIFNNIFEENKHSLYLNLIIILFVGFTYILLQKLIFHPLLLKDIKFILDKPREEIINNANYDGVGDAGNKCISELVNQMEDLKVYLRQKEMHEFVQAGAKEQFVYGMNSAFYENKYFDKDINLLFSLREYIDGSIDEFEYMVSQGWTPGIDAGMVVANFKISKYDNPNLKFKTGVLGEPFDRDILIIWWESSGDYRYVVLVSEKYEESRHEDSHIFPMNCFFGCNVEVSSEKPPSLYIDNSVEGPRYVILESSDSGWEIFQDEEKNLIKEKWEL